MKLNLQLTQTLTLDGSDYLDSQIEELYVELEQVALQVERKRTGKNASKTPLKRNKPKNGLF